MSLTLEGKSYIEENKDKPLEELVQATKARTEEVKAYLLYLEQQEFQEKNKKPQPSPLLNSFARKSGATIMTPAAGTISDILQKQQGKPSPYNKDVRKAFEDK